MNNYEDEFNEEISAIDFAAWLATNAVGFVNNMYRGIVVKKPLHTWLSWFLDWTEYSDFMRNKNE